MEVKGPETGRLGSVSASPLTAGCLGASHLNVSESQFPELYGRGTQNPGLLGGFCGIKVVVY